MKPPLLNPHPRPRAPQQIAALVVKETSKGFAYHTDAGETGQQGVFAYCLGKTVYCNEPMVGVLETIFRDLSADTVKGIYSHKLTEWRGFRIRKELGSGWCVTVRKGRQTGRIINAPNLLGSARTPKAIIKRVERALSLFQQAGFESPGDFRSTGDVAAQIIPPRFSSYYRLPDWTHTERFHNAYRGPRFQGVAFGKVDGHDYDLNTAYPSVLMTLPWFQGLHWFDKPNLGFADHAVYGAALCDIYLNEDLTYAPVSVRWNGPDGYGYIVSPVGKVRRAWLTLPEIRLFSTHPEIGKIIKVHNASWGYPSQKHKPLTPFGDLITRLYWLRFRAGDLGGYVKQVMNSFYGHFMQRYENGRAHSLYNPILASTITAQVRVNLFERSYQSYVLNESVDGVAADAEMVVQDGLGGLHHEGSGAMTFYTPIFKDTPWHPLPEHLRESTQDADSTKLYGVQQLRYTVPYLANTGAHHAQAGDPYEERMEYPLGDVLRSGGELVTMGEVADGKVETQPPTLDFLSRKLANVAALRKEGVL